VVRWSEEKNRELEERRGISFDRIAALYEKEEFEAILKHETRPNQQILVMQIDGYTWAVPFVIEEDGQTLFLKTAYPSRKLHRRYGGEQ
jgi:hypothetical protein